MSGGGPDPGPLPLISILTPCLNGAAFIEEAIESVRAQDYANVEHIVIDGGSTDGTRDVLKKYPHLKVISEPDAGVYDAVNKGLRLARGEIIGLLNADDFYEPGILAAVAEQFVRNEETDMVYGGATVFRENDAGKRETLFAYLSSLQTEPSLSNVTLGAPIINARFFRRRLYDRFGPFDASYRIAADRDFVLRAVLADVCSRHLNRVVYHYRQHDSSLTLDRGARYRTQWAIEHMRMAERHLGTDGLSSRSREAIKFWHSREATVAALGSVRQGRFATALGHVWRGLRFDARYPFRFCWFALLAWRRSAKKNPWLFIARKMVTNPGWVWRKALVRLRNRRDGAA